jgi:hypothetical protein
MSLILSGTDGRSDIDGTAATPAIRGTDANTGIFFPAADTVGMSTGGSERMRIDSAGNVGIGTASPTMRMDINGTSYGGLYIKSTSTNFSGMLLENTNSATKWQIGVEGGLYNTAGKLNIGIDAVGSKLVIDSSGNVGIGTASPSRKLHVSAGADDNSILATSVAGNAYIGFADSGTTSQTGLSVRMGSAGNAMVFQTGGTTERMRIDSSGNLLVAKTATSTVTAGAEIRSADGSFYSTIAATTNATSTYNAYSTGAGAYRFYVGMAGTVFATNTTITAISDQRLKENIRDLDDGLDVVMALKPRKFDWKEGKGAGTKNARGFIAQEFEQVLPDMIEEWKDPAPEGEEAYKAINANLIPTLVKAMQEQQAIIESLKARLDAANL